MSRSLSISALLFLVACTGSPPKQEPEETGLYLPTDDSDPVITEDSPRLSGFSTTQAGNGIVEMSFKLDDDDKDWGELDVMISGEITTLELPEDIDDWNEGGVSKHRFLIEEGVDVCDSHTVVVVAQARDLGGNSSKAASDSVTFQNTDPGVKEAEETEPNDSSAAPNDIGTISTCVTITGQATRYAYDYLTFTTSQAGTYTLQLDYGTTSDVDIYLYDPSISTTSTIASSSSTSASKTLTQAFSDNHTYLVRIDGNSVPSGTTNDWTLRIQLPK